MIKFTPVGLGNHNNLHFNFVMHTKKVTLINIKLVAFQDTGKAYFTNVKASIEFKYLNKEELFNVIKNKLNTFDFDLNFEDNWWLIKGRSSDEIINSLNK